MARQDPVEGLVADSTVDGRVDTLDSVVLGDLLKARE